MNNYQKVYQVFQKNNIVFLNNVYDHQSVSVTAMMKNFDLFHLDGDFLWYRLKYNCKVIDKFNRLHGYNCNRVYLIKLFDNDRPLTNINTVSYVLEDEFYRYRDQGKLKYLIKEYE